MQSTIKNEGMVSLGQSLRQRIIYNNLRKNTRNVMKIEEPETNFNRTLDCFNEILTDMVGYLLFLIAGTGIIALIAAFAH